MNGLKFYRKLGFKNFTAPQNAGQHFLPYLSRENELQSYILATSINLHDNELHKPFPGKSIYNPINPSQCRSCDPQNAGLLILIFFKALKNNRKMIWWTGILINMDIHLKLNFHDMTYVQFFWTPACVSVLWFWSCNRLSKQHKVFYLPTWFFSNFLKEK